MFQHLFRRREKINQSLSNERNHKENFEMVDNISYSEYIQCYFPTQERKKNRKREKVRH